MSKLEAPESIIAGAFRVRRDAKLLAQQAAEDRETKRILAEERDARQARTRAEHEAAAKVERERGRADKVRLTGPERDDFRSRLWSTHESRSIRAREEP